MNQIENKIIGDQNKKKKIFELLILSFHIDITVKQKNQ